MSAIVSRMTAGANRLFFADRTRGGAPFAPKATNVIGEKFNLQEITVQVAGDRSVWVGRRGEITLGNRQLVIEKIFGSENEIGVTVEGSTTEALAVLREAWTALRDFGYGEDLLDEVPGDFAYGTSAIVESSVTYRELVPLFGTLRDEVATRLGAAFQDGSESFKIEIPFAYKLGGVVTPQTIVIERRFTAQADHGIYYTASPLGSDDHVAVLRHIFADLTLGQGESSEPVAAKWLTG